ncbi:PACE efflux transporter [Cellvibrio mixtus]|uniref:PACE efflux transporter n=1 Tax=Cellvibrio mixtus TaxID=39650 RepID=UPI000B201B43|nr:PACE efflux transporter [Cellvibrio mixtus]
MQLVGLQGAKRRVVYVGLYEFIAIVLSAILLELMSNAGAAESLGLAVAASAVAIIWNLIFNGLFERWEASRKQQGRSLGVRILHAIGFEGGLLIFLIPLVAWWYDVSFWQALLMDLGLLVFFLVYTFVFTWAFDRVFGLPAAVNKQYANVCN